MRGAYRLHGAGVDDGSRRASCTEDQPLSPTIFREDGFRFFFFSREESRMHVHVHCADGEAKFWLEPQIELAQNYGLNDRQIRRPRH